VKSGGIPHINEILRRHRLEHTRVPVPELEHPASGAGLLLTSGTQDGSHVSVRQDGGDLERWISFFNCFPNGALGFGFGGAVDVPTVGFGLGVGDDDVVPGFFGDVDDFVGLRHESGGAGGGVDEGFDAGFFRGGGEGVEGALDLVLLSISAFVVLGGLMYLPLPERRRRICR